MPLEILPDCFDDRTHRALDMKVGEAIKEDDLDDIPNLTYTHQYMDLLHAIIENSNDVLDKNMTQRKVLRNLVKTHEDLRSLLAEAWIQKSYHKIRNLAILQSPEAKEQAATEAKLPEALHEQLSLSFKEHYRGVAVEGFYEYLTHNEKRFKTSNKVPYYAKFCSIVQSSGTGKSRMITELSKKNVAVIYMNLRLKEEEFGFPHRDPIPSDILTSFPATEPEYRAICYAFFTALFDTLSEYISTTHATRGEMADVLEWVYQMCDVSLPSRYTARDNFFRKFEDNYNKVHGDLIPALNSSTSRTVSRSEVDETADILRSLSISGEQKPPSYLPTFTRRLFASYRTMTESLEKIFVDDPDQPKLVIAFDEAHPLTAARNGKDGGYRPADVLCRIISQYSHHKNHSTWVVFASTTSKVADFSPPNRKHNSDRVASGGQMLFLPYTQLGWDQSAPKLGDVDAEDISQLKHIAGYGRPLWLSLKAALMYPETVLDTASYKLCGGSRRFDPQETDQVLAVMGQRFGLEVAFGHPDSVEHLETAVASHLLICLSTTVDRNWKFTSYPSEPLLSSVAATQLHSSSTHMDVSLRALLMAVNSGMIDMGQRGELASRLLWLLAKDLFIRTVAKDLVAARPSTWEEHLADCQMIPVVGWLEFIFGPQVWERGIGRKMFENAYLNFSHWVCMKANIGGSDKGNRLSLNEWTLRHWQRTSAVQCCHLQPLIDKAIPIYFKGGPETGSMASRVSQIFVSDKARKSTDSRDALHNITQRHESLRGKNGNLPYISILADLGQSASFSVTFPERNVADRCLRIYAAGVDATTYPFLARYPTLMETLQSLVRLQQIPETELAYTEHLNAQVKFGSTATPEHMCWERGYDATTAQKGPDQ